MGASETAKQWRAHVAALQAESSIHWRAPTVMVFSLFVGILISFVNHLFNTVIDGHSAGGATEQQWVRRLETAFAFSSKLFLAMSTTIAYNQCLWYYLQQNTYRTASIDAMFSATSNLFRFVHRGVWCGRPVLTLIALVTWTLPLAAIFTPGTLTVQPGVHSLFPKITVPERNYSDISFYASALHANESSSYKGMSVETTRNVGRVQLANALLAVPRPDNNVTYTTNFDGPAVSCSRMGSGDVEMVGDALQGLTRSDYLYHGRPFTGSQMVYFGWVPQTTPGLEEVNTTFFEGLITEGNAASSASLDYVSSDAARIYVYLNTSGLTQDVDNDGQFTRVSDTGSTSEALITCALYNASYDVHFDVSTSGDQNISASTTFLNWQSTKSQGLYQDSTLDAFSRQALMEAFGWTFTQFLYVLPASNGSKTVYGTHTLEMNPALLPVQSNIHSNDSAEYMMHQMEDFFKNMTLGLRYADLPDHSDNASLSTLAATSKFFRSDYVYEPDALIISYALSNTISLLCVLAGGLAIYKNKASFTSNFSTIVRVTNHLDLDDAIDEKDRLGSDPLPIHLADTVISLGQQRQRVKQEQEFSSKPVSWHIDEPSLPDRAEWQTSTLRGMGLREPSGRGVAMGF